MRKVWQLPWHDRLLLLEAMFWLATAGLAIAVLPFRHVRRLAALPVRWPEPPQQKRLTDVCRIRWALLACSRRVPWRAKCFEQGLAAQFMLRRRGIPSVLYYGAAPDDQGGLSAHVWVRDRDIDVVGGEVASRYAALATFPPQDDSGTEDMRHNNLRMQLNLPSAQFTAPIRAESLHMAEATLGLPEATKRALAAYQGNRLDEAERFCRGILSAKADHFETIHLIAIIQARRGCHVEALASYECALAVRQDAEAFNNRGNTLQELRRFEEALASYDKAVLIRPDYAEAFKNRGNALKALERFEEALASYDKALVIRPDYAEVFNNRGNALQELNRFEEALASYDKALVIHPNYAEALTNRGNALTKQCKLDEAIAAYHRAIGIRPDLAYSNLALCLHYHDQTTAAELFAVHRDWNEQHGRTVLRPTVYANDREVGRRLKIGYVSPDFCEHSVAYFIEPLLRNHDRQAVDVFCYAEVARPDAVTARLQGYVDHWLVTVGLSDDDLAERIRTDAIDILVDLAGHTARNRLGVFARKPAPVQVTWLGYPDTTGLDAIDYRLVDAVTDPDGEADAWASETLVRIYGGFLCYGGWKDAPKPTVPPCLTTDTVTFGSFNNPAKLSGATLDAWAKLLARLPQARLLLKGKPFADAATRALFVSRLVERGIAAERVMLVAWLSSGTAHLGLYNRIDIALDPFPYNGTTTTCEALWMGVPVVTLRGERHAGRIGASLLTQAGLTDWIAGSAEEYLEIAATLAGDPDQLSDLRRSLRDRLTASPLCDGCAFARKIETAYRTMWRNWCETATETPELKLSRRAARA